MEHFRKKEKRSTRRAATRRHNRRQMDIVLCRSLRCAGYVDWIWENGTYYSTGKYVKFPKNSLNRQYLKRCSNKMVRRKNERTHGNQYRKLFNYQRMIY